MSNRMLGYNRSMQLLWLLAVLLTPSTAFYVPGVAPIDYNQDELVEVKAVKMTSSQTQLPYEYYSLNFCRPQKIEHQTENLGEVLRGDRIVNTKYNIQMNVDHSCQVQCSQNMKSADIDLFKQRIEEGYRIHLLADNLPSATQFSDENDTFYRHGFKLGYKNNGKYYINNHLAIILKYNKLVNANGESDVFRLVGFEVQPKSVNDVKRDEDICKLSGSQLQNNDPKELNDSTMEITFSYSVKWIKSETRWASRWDMYLAVQGDMHIHWFSIVNSVIIILFLFAFIAIIIVKTIRRDINQYNIEEDEETLIENSYEETGWKLVHADVFRQPRNCEFLMANIGAGIQLFLMSIVTVFFAMLGMLSPSSRGSLVSTMFFLYVVMGYFAGHFSTLLYKSFKGKMWVRTSVLTAIYYPALSFTVCFLLNFVVWYQGSSKAVPFTTMIALICMWLGVALPITLIGSFFAFKKRAFEHPVRTNHIPRAIPNQISSNSFLSIVLAGALPFAAVFIELVFIFESLFENQFYYMFGFLFLVYVIVMVAVAQIAIVIVYLRLCAENHNWMWNSFLSSCGISLYIFAYLIYYYTTKLDITSFTPIVLYFSYSLLICFTIAIITGTVGFISSYCFVRQIYAQIKID